MPLSNLKKMAKSKRSTRQVHKSAKKGRRQAGMACGRKDEQEAKGAKEERKAKGAKRSKRRKEGRKDRRSEVKEG